jgi:hypothetical protein
VTARPRTRTPAQQRLVDEVLAWGLERPIPPEGLSERLLTRLTPALGALIELRAHRPDLARRPLLVTKTRLSRLVCDGLQQEPEPYVHAWANVRGTLVHAAIEADVDGARADDAGAVVERAWHRLATQRPGDPASIGSWLNARDGTERDALMGESRTLLEGFREVWPELADVPIRVRTEQRLVVMLGGRAVQLQGVPDLIVESPVEDGRARRLIIDLKTGMPRGQRDRDELRFYALLATLAGGSAPFRWATLYVTEGRLEHEDLSEPILATAAERIADAVLQAVRIAQVGVGAAQERIAGGAWCRGCARRTTCTDAVVVGDAG